MAESRRKTRSTRAWRGGQQTDAEFWSNQLNPVQIEKGQAAAIQLVRSTINSAPNEPTELNMTGTSGVPPMVFVDDEGLEEQFLTEDEASQNILDITANHVTTPVDTAPVGTDIQPQEEELDLQPSRGPKEESLVNTIGQFLDQNYEDVLHTSNINTNFRICASDRNSTGHPVLPLGWIVPDGTNRTLEEIKDKKISNGISPGGGQAGAMIVSLQWLEPYYGTQFFLVDLEMGEVFAYIQQQWRRAGLYCSNQPFVVNDFIIKVEHHGQAMWAELEAEQQTPLVDIRRSNQFAVPPLLPAMDEPDIYVLHPDAMQVNTRKKYVRDRMRAALIYISECMGTKNMMKENRYNNEELLVRLRTTFGRVDQIRDRIDRALQQDDAHHRKREMRFLLLPICFPRPESMEQGDITVWINWICEETEVIMNQLEEEEDARSDPDDPFNGTANGVFLLSKIHYHYPLQYVHQEGTKTTVNIEKLFKTHVKVLEK